jgi:hypothetical protein
MISGSRMSKVSEPKALAMGEHLDRCRETDKHDATLATRLLRVMEHG